MGNLKLESVQIEAGRIIRGLRSNYYRQKLYREFEGRGSLENRRNKYKLTLLYKILNGLTPAYLWELIQSYPPRQCGYNLRNENNLIHFTHRFPEQVLFMIVLSLSLLDYQILYP